MTPERSFSPTERRCLDDKPGNAAISQVFKHLIHLGGDAETARLAFTLVLPAPPEGAFAPTKPSSSQSKSVPGWHVPCSGQCWSTFWGHLHPRGMAPGPPATLGNNTAHGGTGNHPSQSRARPRDHPTFAEETLDALPNALAAGLGICPDQWQDSSSYPGARR